MRTVAETSEVRVHIRNFALMMKQHAFDGSDPMKIFEIISRFVNEADMHRMSEAQAFIALPIFMSHPAEKNFRTSIGGTSQKGTVTCWPEAVQHLLRTYATPAAMLEVMDKLRSIRQGETETEESYRNRLHESINLCGNVHNKGEKITL